MQTLTEVDNNVVDELQLLEIANTPREKAARQFIIEAFKIKMSSLIPFALTNESVINVASYLLKYTKSKSKATLYQYVFSIYRFCQWIENSPDDIIKEVLFKKILSCFRRILTMQENCIL